MLWNRNVSDTGVMPLPSGETCVLGTVFSLLRIFTSLSISFAVVRSSTPCPLGLASAFSSTFGGGPSPFLLIPVAVPTFVRSCVA